jgi:hypothetical protein
VSVVEAATAKIEEVEQQLRGIQQQYHSLTQSIGGQHPWIKREYPLTEQQDTAPAPPPTPAHGPASTAAAIIAPASPQAHAHPITQDGVLALCTHQANHVANSIRMRATSRSSTTATHRLQASKICAMLNEISQLLQLQSSDAEGEAQVEAGGNAPPLHQDNYPQQQYHHQHTVDD